MKLFGMLLLTTAALLPIVMRPISAAEAAPDTPTQTTQLILSKEGPLTVQTADDLTLRDVARNKELICKVYFPTSGGPYPVILFSHGFGGNKDAFGPVSKHWASHGYVVIHASHADGIGRWRVAQAGRVTPRRGVPNDPQKVADRVGDLVLLLDSLDALPQAIPSLKGKIDTQKVGVGGHSLGAYTTMLIGGVRVDLGKEKDKSFLDKRVKCLLPVSAQGTGQQGLSKTSWEGLKLPMMTITGTLDRGAGGQGLDWKKEPYQYSPPGDKYLVIINGANHMSFGGALGTRGAAITEVVKLCSTQFWDAYLKGSAAAKQYLALDRLTRDTNGKCILERK